MIFIAVDIIDILLIIKLNIQHKKSSIKCKQHWSNWFVTAFLCQIYLNQSLTHTVLLFQNNKLHLKV